MSRTEFFFYPRQTNAGVATKRIARFPQRMAALRLTTVSRFNREKASA
jgi:hypothetical protein